MVWGMGGGINNTTKIKKHAAAITYTKNTKGPPSLSFLFFLFPPSFFLIYLFIYFFKFTIHRRVG
jgi:hypothetical protein